MKIDTFFVQGTTHRVCQDYALHGEDFIILCDGCSSKPDTDIGARLLARAAVQTLKEEGTLSVEEFQQRLLGTALGYCQALGLSIDCLFATLLMAFPFKSGWAIQMLGDGTLAYREDGSLHIYDISYPTNAPFYPIYRKNREMLEEYLEYGSTLVIRHVIIGPDGSVTKDTKATEEILSFPKDWGATAWQDYLPSISDIALFSDGASSCVLPVDKGTSKESEPVDVVDVVKELMAIKSYQGAFVTRRVRMALRRKGWQNTDDLSVGLIHMECPQAREEEK